MAYPFVVVEGIDGSGKNTQIENIVRYVKKKRQKVNTFVFPTKNAKKVHEHLQKKKKISEDELFDAFLEDIADNQEDIANALRHGWVIADRYCISTAAYQSVESDIDQRMQRIENLQLLKPDFVFWLDVDPKMGVKRKIEQGVKSRFDENIEFLKRVSDNYLHLYKTEFMCSNWLRIDADKEQKKVGSQIIGALEGKQKAAEAY
jgi:dTMP kinase